MGTSNLFCAARRFQGSKLLFGVGTGFHHRRIIKSSIRGPDISVMGCKGGRSSFRDSFEFGLGSQGIPSTASKSMTRRYNDEPLYPRLLFIRVHGPCRAKAASLPLSPTKEFMDPQGLRPSDAISARRAEFIGAIRLPSTAFKALAGNRWSFHGYRFLERGVHRT